MGNSEQEKKNNESRELYETGAWIGVGAVVLGLVQSTMLGNANTFWALCILVGPLVTIVCLVLRGQLPKS
jgi:uncharacterized protein (DUF983 family)